MERKFMKRVAGGLLAAAVMAASTASVSASSESSMTGGDLRKHLSVVADPIILNADAAADLNERMGNYTAPEESLIKNNAPMFYYYEHLEPEEKQIYDVIKTVASDPTDIDNIGLLMTTTDPESEDFLYHYYRAFYSLLDDHPEFFWLYIMDDIRINIGYERESSNGIHFVYFMLTEPYTKFEEEMKRFNDAAADFLKDIDTSISDYDTIRQIHDKLMKIASYNHPVCDENRNSDLAHTAYGALVEDSNGTANAPVCDGYSLAMEYLLQQCGLEVMVVSGDAGSDALSAGGHAWNLVKLDNKWYEMDSTWDDNMQEQEQYLDPNMDMYDYFVRALQDQEYVNKISHYLFLVSTGTISNFSSTDDYKYYFDDGAWINVMGNSVHKRWGTDGSMQIRNAQLSIYNNTPIAENGY